MVDRKKALCLARRYAGFNGSQSYLCRRYFGKSFGQAIFEKDIEGIKDQWKQNPYFESDDKNIRQMTLRECERLQTLPDFYTDVDGVSEQMKYEAIGNGWTVDVIAHILSYIKKEEKEKKTMELKMNAYQLPEKISFNFDELKQELTEKVSMYETLVYTDDQIKEAKADKAQLNKLKKALNDERIRLEKEYMVPFNSFKSQVNEIISIIEKPVALIDKQVKEYEDKQKQDKMEQIKALWAEMDVPEGLTLERVFEDRMLNVSYGLNHVKQKMLDDIKRFNLDMETLAALPEFGFEAQQEYIRTFDLNKALAEGQRMAQIQKQKAEAERLKAEREAEQARLKAEEEARKAADAEFARNINPPAEEVAATEETPAQPVRQWIRFAANLTVGEAMELKNFFSTHGIEYKAI